MIVCSRHSAEAVVTYLGTGWRGEVQRVGDGGRDVDEHRGEQDVME